tara:strand:- start:828 stop:971 length:144 start_codon:yes stop_codon:yes gene_type:complete
VYQNSSDTWYEGEIEFSEKTDIVVRAKADGSTLFISGGYTLYLVVDH